MGTRRSDNTLGDFGRFVREHEAFVYRLAWAYFRDDAYAREAAQTVFVKAFEKQDSFRGKAKPSTWLFTIARNTCHDMARRKRRERSRLTSLVGITDTPAENNDDIRAVRESIASLPERYRDVVFLYYMEEKSCGDIADMLSLSVTNVQTMLYRARKMLEKQLRHVLP